MRLLSAVLVSSCLACGPDVVEDAGGYDAGQKVDETHEACEAWVQTVQIMGCVPGWPTDADCEYARDRICRRVDYYACRTEGDYCREAGGLQEAACDATCETDDAGA